MLKTILMQYFLLVILIFVFNDALISQQDESGYDSNLAQSPGCR